MKRRTLLVTGCAMPLALVLLARHRRGARARHRRPLRRMRLGLRRPAGDARFSVRASRPSNEPGAPHGHRQAWSRTTRGARRRRTSSSTRITPIKTGIYPRAGNRHGTLRGWALTDAQGRYRFDTIRPGAYPSRNVAEHVHMHVIEPGMGTYYIDEPRVPRRSAEFTTRRRRRTRGGNGLVMPARRDGVWHVRRDIVLGRNIPGYPSNDKRSRDAPPPREPATCRSHAVTALRRTPDGATPNICWNARRMRSGSPKPQLRATSCTDDAAALDLRARSFGAQAHDRPRRTGARLGLKHAREIARAHARLRRELFHR